MKVKIMRQETPESEPYWERFDVETDREHCHES